MASRILLSCKPLLINEDAAGSPPQNGALMDAGVTSSLGVPISAGGETVGVVGVQTTDEDRRFTEGDLRLLATIAASVGVALHNARLFEEAAQARASAEAADAAKSAFLSTVSHELRTPLTSVLGFAKIIKRRLAERLFPLIPGDDRKVVQTMQQVSENLNVVVSEGERLTKLIDEVLDLAKIEAGKFEWRMDSLSASEIVDRALAATSSLVENKPITLSADVMPELPRFTGDRDRLIQVVINLISNAVKFTREGLVTCRARQMGNEVVISVTDTGLGIAPDDQPKVFEKFKQVGNTLTDKPKGTGLGLPICKEIVEHLGGKIWLESELGKGSTFSFSIPLKVEATAPGPLNLESFVRRLRESVDGNTTGNGRHSILVVDDDPHIRELLREELQEAGHIVRLAADGREALNMVRGEKPGLVVLDVMMPEMNGFDVAAVLRNDPATMDLPIVMLSIVEDKERGYRLGIDRYLTKPVNTELLLREIGALMEQGKSKKKVMIVDEDATTVKTLAEVLQVRGYHVVETNGDDLVQQALTLKPDVIILNSVLSSKGEIMQSLRFEKGLENVLFLIYQ
jgi:signal transduction histidine kinase/DNA-binding response OmpR family regulator